MSDNKKITKQNIDAAIDPALGIGGILAVNHNDVLTQTLNVAGKYTGQYFQAKGALDELAPTGTFLWNGNAPNTLTDFVIRLSKLTADLVDVGEYLSMLNVDEKITFKDFVGRAFVLKYQSHVAGTDGSSNAIYDVTVQGVATNSNYIYAPTEIETCGIDFITMGGAGGGVASVNSGEAITIDNAIPTAPIVNLGGSVNTEIVIDIVGTPAEAESIEFTGTADAGDTISYLILPEGTQLTIDDGTPNTVTNAGFYAGSINLNTQNLSGTSKTHVVNIGDNDRVFISASDSVSGDVISFALYDDKVELTTPAVEAGTAVVGQVLTLQNAITGEVEFAAAGGAGNTIYNANDALTATRTVDLATFQLNFINGANAIRMNNGRLGVKTEVFGGTRLGDSDLQTPTIDVQSINFKDAGQLTALAMFFTAVGGSDGYVTTMKNFVDDVNVISVAGVGAATYNGAAREVEATHGLRNDFTGGQFRVFDTFNNDYDAATPVATAQGWVAIHGGGAVGKQIGLWRYDGATYDPIWTTGNTDKIVTFAVAPKSNVAASAANDLVRFDQLPATSGFMDLTTNQTAGGQKQFSDILRANNGLNVTASIKYTYQLNSAGLQVQDTTIASPNNGGFYINASGNKYNIVTPQNVAFNSSPKMNFENVDNTIATGDPTAHVATILGRLKGQDGIAADDYATVGQLGGGGGGVANPQMSWLFDAATGTGNPGTGEIRFNNTTPASITSVFINYAVTHGADITDWIENVKAGDTVYFQQASDATKYIVMNVTTVSDQTTYFRINGTVTDSGTIPTAGEPIGLELSQVADLTQTLGAWTPVLTDLGGGATYTQTVNNATYTKVGSLVMLHLYLTNINTTGVPTGEFVIDGTPFAATGSPFAAGSTHTIIGCDNSFSWLVPYTNSTGNRIRFSKKTVDGPANMGNFNAVTWTNGIMILSITYRGN